MADQPVEIVGKFYEAYKRKDLDAILELLDPEVTFYQSPAVPWGGRYHGLEEVQSFFARLVATIASQVDVEQLIEAGNRVVAIGRSRGTVRATDRPFEVVAIHVCEIRHGKVVSFQAYLDTPKMLEALAA